MLTLYYKPTCPFCRRVIAVIERLEIEVEMKDVTTDEAIYAELEERGGKRQIPFLYDDNMTPDNMSDDVDMYESDDIIAYLQKQHGGETTASPKPRVHISDSACLSCEG